VGQQQCQQHKGPLQLALPIMVADSWAFGCVVQGLEMCPASGISGASDCCHAESSGFNCRWWGKLAVAALLPGCVSS
jgi:hypothetical protein